LLGHGFNGRGGTLDVRFRRRRGLLHLGRQRLLRRPLRRKALLGHRFRLRRWALRHRGRRGRMLVLLLRSRGQVVPWRQAGWRMLLILGDPFSFLRLLLNLLIDLDHRQRRLT
jgi:hypothetical protein